MEDRFNSLGRFLKKTFGERVHRANINIPGKKFETEETPEGYALCLGGPLEAPVSTGETLSVKEQLRKAKERIRTKFKIGKYIIHFHSRTGEYLSLKTIEDTIETTLQDNEIIGLNFTVRMNHLDNDMTSLLSKTSKYIYLWLETGIYTANDSTLEKLGANFRFSDVLEKMEALMRKNIQASPHIVLGLPGETDEMMRQTMEKVSTMLVKGVNMQHFCMHNGSPFAQAYNNNEIKLLSQKEYVSLACDFIEILPPKIVLRRIVGEMPHQSLLGPEWTKNKRESITAISEEMERRNSRQGCKNRLYEYEVMNSYQNGEPEKKETVLETAKPAAND